VDPRQIEFRVCYSEDSISISKSCSGSEIQGELGSGFVFDISVLYSGYIRCFGPRFGNEQPEVDIIMN